MSDSPELRRHTLVVGEAKFELIDGQRYVIGRDPACELRTFADAPPDGLLPAIEGLISSGWLPDPARAPRLRWVQTLNAGHEDLPDALVSDPNVEVCHGSGPAAVPIAEWTLAAMLFFGHRFRRILAHERDRTWHRARAAEMSASVLHDRTVGILGYGADSEIHSAKILRLSDDLPVIVEIIDTEENLQKILPYLEEWIEDGFATLEKVGVIKYSKRKS